MTIWLIMLALAIGTFLIRGSFIMLIGHRELPPWLSRALRFIPGSVLSALVVPQILSYHGAIQFSPSNPQLIAGVAATIVAWRTRNVLLTILSGMVVLWALQLLAAGG